MSNVPHIHRRVGGVWYFERRVPLDVVHRFDAWLRVFNGKRLWRRSLLSRNQIDALERYYDVATEFEALLADARGKSAPTKASAHDLLKEARVLTADEYKAVGHREHRKLTTYWSQLSARSNVNTEAAARFDAESVDYLACRPRRLEQIKDRGLRLDGAGDVLSPFARANEINIENGYHMSLESDRFGVLVGMVRDAMIRADLDIVAIINGALTSPSSASPVARDAAQINRALARRTPTISEMVKTYVDAGGSKGRLAVRTKNGIRQALNDFIRAVGDKQAHLITKQDVHAFFTQEGAKVIGTRTEAGVVRSTSPATITKKLTFLRAAIGMAIERETFEGPNPLVGVKLAGFVKAVDKAVMPDKRAFNLGELRSIFAHPWFAGCASGSDRGSLLPGTVRLNDSRFWGPVLAVYTGCRAAELGGLKIDEVKIDDDHPHLIIRPNSYRRTKSNKTRHVPILDAVLRLGFGTYLAEINAAGGDRVFPDWEPPERHSEDGGSEAQWASAKWPKAFNRTILPAVSTTASSAEARRDVTLHSFRGSFKRLLEDSAMPQQYVDDIIGHAKHELDQRYSGTRDIDILSERARKLEYVNLGLTSPKMLEGSDVT